MYSWILNAIQFALLAAITCDVRKTERENGNVFVNKEGVEVFRTL